MNWNDLFAALGLMLIVEGIMPFLNPQGTRRAMAMLSRLNDGPLRVGGFVGMLIGLATLYLVRF